MTEKNFLTKTLTDTVLSRRSFLKWSAALGGTAALAGGLNFGLKTVEAAAQTAETDGKWVPVACWHNCGGRCLNVALVKDGVVVRQKTDDTHPDSPDYPQQRGCARGRSQRRQVFGADRIKYPMKRKNWVPGGGQKQLRGIDEWVRISWDEALDIVASEIKRTLDEHGNKAILTGRFTPSQFLNALGGAVMSWGVTSDGAWPLPVFVMGGGLPASFFLPANDRMDMRNSKLLVLWGANPAWSSGGNPAYNLLQNKKAGGTKVIIVDPFYSPTSQVLADEWIPCRPGTDTALLLAIAYYMLENNLHDQAFLDTYTVGFDRDHMPEGADPKENFKDYVLGTYDSIPKTPEWASKICGTSPDVIRNFAQEWATTKPAMLISGAAPARTSRGQQYCQAFLTVGWMTGNIGIPGGGVFERYHNVSSYGGPSLVQPGGSGVNFLPNPLFPTAGAFGGYAFSGAFDTDYYGMAYEEIWDAILNGEFTASVRGKVPCDIRMMYSIFEDSGSNDLNQIADINKGIEAHRKLEFVVSGDIVLSSRSKYADIVLPLTTPWEKAAGGLLTGNPEMLLCYSQVTPPLYEAKDALWVERELCTRLDLDPDEIYPLSLEQQTFNQLAGATVMKSDGSGYEPLLTITADDISAMGIEGKSQKGRISLQEFKEKGVYQVPRSPGDKFTFVAGKAFREDPIANPLPTASGKLEIHCQTLSAIINAFGFMELPPIAKYLPPAEGIEGTFEDFKTGVKGEYPLQLVTIHYLRRSHSVFNNVPQLRRAFPQEFMMNPIDAEARGLKHGDYVLIRSRHGKVVRPVALMDRVTPGVVFLGEGAWVEKDEALNIDFAGATNTLNGSYPTGQGEEPWNTCNVQVEKWTGKIPDLDYKWPQRIPIEEA